jgi:hypothetical protein
MGPFRCQRDRVRILRSFAPRFFVQGFWKEMTILKLSLKTTQLAVSIGHIQGCELTNCACVVRLNQPPRNGRILKHPRMLRPLAQWWAKRKYIWKLEMEAGTNEVNAALSARRAEEKRKFVEQLNKEAQGIEDNIVVEEAKPEYQALAGQEKYEADREKNEAKKIVASKRQLAEEEAKNAEGGEETAKHFRAQASNARTVADKIRSL